MFRLPSFMSRWSKPKDMRLICTFNAGNGMPQYDDYLKRRPDMKGVRYGRARITQTQEEMLASVFRSARGLYQKEETDYWDHILPGDCENQCLYVRKHSRDWIGSMELFNSIRLVVCRTDKGENHLVLCFDEINGDGQLSERIMDFRLNDPLLPIGHRAFDSYQFFRAHTPGTADWQFCLRKMRRDTQEILSS